MKLCLFTGIDGGVGSPIFTDYVVLYFYKLESDQFYIYKPAFYIHKTVFYIYKTWNLQMLIFYIYKIQGILQNSHVASADEW